MKKLIMTLLVTTLLLTCTACGGSKKEENPASTEPAQASASETTDNTSAEDGKAHVNLLLILEDGTEVPFEIAITPDSNLRDALLEAGLIAEEEYSQLFIKTIDQYTADWEAEKARTWEVRDAEGNKIDGFFEEIILEDGKTYQIVDVEVPYFDD